MEIHLILLAFLGAFIAFSAQKFNRKRKAKKEAQDALNIKLDVEKQLLQFIYCYDFRDYDLAYLKSKEKQAKRILEIAIDTARFKCLDMNAIYKEVELIRFNIDEFFDEQRKKLNAD